MTMLLQVLNLHDCNIMHARIVTTLLYNRAPLIDLTRANDLRGVKTAMAEMSTTEESIFTQEKVTLIAAVAKLTKIVENSVSSCEE